ncbi:MAG TPA: c-type cytochrome [Geobacteraceae bacterium]
MTRVRSLPSRKLAAVYFLVMVGSVVLCACTTAVNPGRGEFLFHQKCLGCHGFRGEGGHLAPDLTKVAAHRDRSYITTKLKSPKKTNPGSIMPSFGDLPKNDFQDLLSFLLTLK